VNLPKLILSSKTCPLCQPKLKTLLAHNPDVTNHDVKIPDVTNPDVSMSIRPIRVELTNAFRSERSRKLRCRNDLFTEETLN